MNEKVNWKKPLVGKIVFWNKIKKKWYHEKESKDNIIFHKRNEEEIYKCNGKTYLKIKGEK